MLNTDELAQDVGSVIYGAQAAKLGLIDQLGGLSDALRALHQMIRKDGAEQRGETAEQ